MSDIAIGHINILETGTVTATSAAAGYPAYRLYDRYGGLMWKGTSTADQTIQVDQGATSILVVSALFIPEGHNLSGCTIYWERSDNGSAWTEVDHWTQSGSGAILRNAASDLTHRYHRVRITGASAAAEVGECIITKMNAFASVKPEDVQNPWEWNVRRTVTPAGVASYIEDGERPEVENFRLGFMDAADWAICSAWLSAWAGSKPFVFSDLNGVTYMAEIIGRPVTRRHPGLLRSVDLQIREALG